MPTRVEDTGLAFIAAYLAALDWTLSLHTGDPGADLAANELATDADKAVRAYGRHTELAANWSASGATCDNDNAIPIFTPTATEQGTVVNHLGIRRGNTVYGRMELIAPVTLVAARPFRIAAGTIDLMLARPA